MSEPARTNVSAFPHVSVLMPRLRKMADIPEERLVWLSKGRLAEGKFTILDGDPGLGKSTITLDWAARITTGRPLPNGPTNRPRCVIMLSAEDGLGDTVRPRFAVAGGDLNKLFVFEMVDDEGLVSLPSIPGNLEGLSHMVEAVDAALIIIDPLVAFLGADVKANSDQDVRRALSPLAALTDRTRAAVLALRHLNKATGMSSLYRGGGSIGIVGAARFALLAARDPEDETGKRRLLAFQKCNIGEEPPTLAYHLEGVPGTDVAYISWDGESTVRANALTEGPKSEGDRAGAEEAKAWLLDALEYGPVGSKHLQRQARDDGINWRTIEAVKAGCGVQSGRKGFGPGATYSWWLPIEKRHAPPHGPPHGPPEQESHEEA